MFKNWTPNNYHCLGIFLNSTLWCHHSHGPLPALDCPKSDPISLHPAPPPPESGIYLKSTDYSCWFMAFKKAGLWYPCQLKAPWVAVLLAGSLLFLRQDHYLSSFHTVQSHVHFLTTCTLQNTCSLCFPPNTGSRLKYKVLFPLKSLRKPFLFPLDLVVIQSWGFLRVLLSPCERRLKKRGRLHISIFHPWPTVWFHTTHCFTKHAYWAACRSQKALMQSHSDLLARPSVLTHIHTVLTYMHPLL